MEIMNTAPETGERNGTTQLRTRETAGEVFDDGGMIELVRDADQPSQLALLISAEGKHEVLPSFEHQNQVYVPVALDRTTTKAIRLPTHAAEFGTITDLLASMTAAIERFTALPTNTARCAAVLALATWFTDCSPEAPLLLLTGPPPEALRLLWIL